MRVAWVVALVLGGCGLTLDLDPPDPKVGIDGGARDSGPEDAGDAGPVDSCGGAADGTACGDEPPRICLGGLCVRSRCGDGIVDPRAGETCEDGNEISGDGCEPGICRYSCESDDDCSVTDPMCAAGVCTDAHGCSVALVPEETECTSGAKAGECRAGMCIPTTCGDGQLDADEACDDGNTEPGDGCEHDCSLICETDEDCSDGVECNGLEVCEREAHPDGALRATCRSGRAAPIPPCFDCNLLTGRLELIDADGDGYAPDDDPACEGRGGDCDDADPRRHPGAPDFGPDGDRVDNDCDGEIDEDRVVTCYRDADGDGFGVPIESPGPVMPEVGCPAGTIPVPSDMSVRRDCDDADPDVFPGQTAWFTTSRCADGTTLPPGELCWDYDCDHAETLRWPRAAACLGVLDRCNDQGWSLGDGLVIPSCGESGTWTTCVDLGLACLAQLSGSPRAQACR